MKNEYEFTVIVNRNHQKAKAQEFTIPEYEYTDHEIRMNALRRKAKRDQVKANHEAMYIGFMMIVGIPIFWILLRLMISCMWAYSFAVRGF